MEIGLMVLKAFVREHMTWALPIWRTIYNVRNQFIGRRRLKEAAAVQENLEHVVSALQKCDGPIRVGFYVFNESVFPLESLFQLMVHDKQFSPSVVVTCDREYNDSEGSKSRLAIHRRTVQSLNEKYPGSVLDSLKDMCAIDYSEQFDVCAVSYPYEAYAHPYCQISFLAKHRKLVIYTDYGTYTGCVQVSGYLHMSVFAYLWRYYAGVAEMGKRIEKAHPCLAEHHRIVVSGSPKISAFAQKLQKKHLRKIVIIAPHHTICETELFHISNFVQYSDFIARLPKRYPMIDWVFRPHPNLLPKMVDLGYWTQDQCDAYIRNWESQPNAKYQIGGAYYATLVNSDGLIQDCASFLAEYFATGHPQCYMLKSPEHEKLQYAGLGLEMLEHVYRAYSEKDIIQYIEEVVLKGHDPMQKARERFAKEKLLINYPHASEFILNDIKHALGRV